jgi:hypothetical protein
VPEVPKAPPLSAPNVAKGELLVASFPKPDAANALADADVGAAAFVGEGAGFSASGCDSFYTMSGWGSLCVATRSRLNERMILHLSPDHGASSFLVLSA